METAIHIAPQLLLIMIVPLALIFFGVFFAAITAERRRRNKVTRAILGQLKPVQEHHEHQDAPRSRYAYAMEQQEREPLVYQQIRPVYFRGRNLERRGE